MNPKRYILRDDRVRGLAIDMLRAMPVGGDRPLEVIIRPYEPDRSAEQNALYWKLLGYWAGETGDDVKSLHAMMRERFLGYIRHPKADGTYIEELRSTADLKKREFSAYYTQVEAFAASLGIMLPYHERV